ncbi:mediator complex subunit [Lambiella insularis]|nr:mediator complex subunit [Lambiella insularis]
MPMMMEDYDDLFSDALPLPPAPLAPGLQERLDELRTNGASHKIAWSKMGCIAYITADGKELHVATLRHRNDHNTWDLHLHADPTLGEHIAKIYKGRELANLSWNPSGLELVVADVYGRLSVCTTVIATNRLMVSKVWLSEPENHFNAMVGSTWLNVKKVVPLYRSATRQDGQWNYAATQYEMKGPHNPWAIKAPLSAMVVISRGGTLRLIYQGQDAQWQDVRHEIDELSTSNDLFTHASLCSDKGESLLLAVHTAGKQLRLYRVTIDWQQSTGKDQITSLPKVLFQHLDSVDECCPMLDDTSLEQGNFTLPSPEAKLSHLELLPQSTDVRTKEITPATVLVIFSHVASQYSTVGAREQAHTILSRWVYRNVESTLHTAFGSLTSKKSGPPVKLKEVTALVRLQDIRVENVAIDVQLINLNATVAISYSDGSVDLRDKTTLQHLSPDEGPDKITSLAQVGFSFQATETCLHMALSPNTCIKAFFGLKHEPKMACIQPMSRHVDFQDSIFTEKVAAAFVLHNAMAGYSNNNNDDLLMTMQEYMRQLTSDQSPESLALRNKMEKDFLSDLYRTLGINLDQSTDPQSEKLLRYPMLQRCLSLQAALGISGDKGTRSITSKVAWALMNLRMFSLTFAFAFAKSGNAADGSGELSKPEVLHGMIGPADWSMTLTDYILDGLFSLNRSIDPAVGFSMSAIRAQVSTTLCPALPLLLTSTSRTFLRYNCRGLRGLSTLATTNLLPTTPPSPSLGPASRALTHIFSAAHLPPRVLETLFAEIDSMVKHAYAAASPPIADPQRQALEREMLVGGEVPAVLTGVVEKVVVEVVEKLRAEVGVLEGELHFGDFKSLGFEKGRGDGRLVDGVRKVRLGRRGREVKLRTCARCGTVMEDLLPVKGASPWIVNLQRTCFCGGFWMV